MKRKCISIILLSTTFLFSSYALADTEGTVKFKGVITDPSCELEIENKEIDLGKHVVTELEFKSFDANKTTKTYDASYKSTNYATLNVTKCPVKNGRVYIKLSGPRDEVEFYKGNSSVATPFVDSNVGGVGVYLFVEGAAKTFDGKANTSNYLLLNGTDNEEFDVKIDASQGTGSLIAHFWLYATRKSSVDTGTMNIPVTATLYMQ